VRPLLCTKRIPGTGKAFDTTGSDGFAERSEMSGYFGNFSGGIGRVCVFWAACGQKSKRWPFTERKMMDSL